MSFEKGTTALSIFRLPDKLPEDALEIFESRIPCSYDETGLKRISVGLAVAIFWNVRLMKVQQSLVVTTT